MFSKEEYEILRAEIDENVKKQDSSFALIITVLSIGSVFTTWYENIAFLMLLLFVSAIILIRIQECRNTIYYISTYLRVNECNMKERIFWESRFLEFKKRQYSPEHYKKFSDFLIYRFAVCGAIVKQLGNLGLATFIFYRLISRLIYDVIPVSIKAIYYVLAILLFTMNVIFTILICIDKRIIPKYLDQWDSITQESTHNLSIKQEYNKEK